MEETKFKKVMKVIGAVGLVVLAALVTGFCSWVVVCGITKIVTICFGLEFTWGIGTGVWVITISTYELFGNKYTKSKVAKN